MRSKDDPSPTSQSLAARIAQLKRGIARLIDAYGGGLLEKDEFEPKIRQLKARLTRLEVEEQGLTPEKARRAELRLIIGQLEEFTQRMDQGLEEADWSTRREIIRALVKQIEVSDDQVRIVYRVNTVPFVRAPNGGVSQDVVGVLTPFLFRALRIFPYAKLHETATQAGTLCRRRQLLWMGNDPTRTFGWSLHCSRAAVRAQPQPSLRRNAASSARTGTGVSATD